MDYELIKEKITVGTIAYSGCKEQPIDIDLTLPDFCTDIKKVLKCKITPFINTKSINGDTLEIDGTAGLLIIYLDNDSGSIRTYEHMIPFNTVMAIKNTITDYAVLVTSKMEYVNCRVLTPRRVDIHGAFSVCAKIISKSDKEITTDIDGDDTQKNYIETSVAKIAGFGEQMITLNDSQPLPNGKSAPENILKKDAVINIDDIKIIPDKMMIKGAVQVKLLYISNLESGETGTLEYKIEFNKIIDISGVDENSKYSVTPMLGSLSVTYNSDESLINTDIKMCITAVAYNDVQMKYLNDTYSMKYDMITTSSQTFLPSIQSEICKTLSEKSSISLSDRNISSIIDIWAESSIPIHIDTSNSSYTISGRAPVYILGMSDDGEIFFIEKNVDVSFPIEDDTHAEMMSAEVYACILSTSGKIINGNSIEINMDIKLQGIVLGDKQINYITSASSDEDSVVDNTDRGMILYYTEKGEKLWDITKKYKISVDMVKEENNIGDSDDLEKMVLILPL